MRSSLPFLVTALAMLLVGIWGSAETVAPYSEEVVLEVKLASSSGATIPATITRVKSVESIPFWVEYELSGLEEDATVVWMMERPISQEDPTTQEVEGRTARFVSPSNAWDHSFELRVLNEGELYRWQEVIDFPLHNQTEILLDASQFGSSEADSVLWSARNWTPDDAVTFPIDDPSATSTTMTSEWPNVIHVSCLIEDERGESSEIETEALLFWRDGPPFEIRGTIASVNDPYPLQYSFPDMVTTQIDHLLDLGVNLISHQHREYFAAPDEQGTFDIHPLTRAYWPPNPNGFTPPLARVAYYFRRLDEAGFQIHVQLRQFNYPSIVGSYSSSGYGSEEGFMATDGWTTSWLESHLRNITFFSEILSEDGVPIVDSITIDAEQGWVLDSGGEATRLMQASLIEAIRDPDSDDGATFGGSLSYAPNYRHSQRDWSSPPLRSGAYSADSGVYFDGLDFLSLTFFPTLSRTPGTPLPDLTNEMLGQIDRYLVPFSKAHDDKPIFLEEVLAWASYGCEISPVDETRHETTGYSPESQLNYFAAVLRAIAATNRQRSSPLFKGLAMGFYGVVPDQWMIGRDDVPVTPWLNEAYGRRDLQLLMKAYYVDKPASLDSL